MNQEKEDGATTVRERAPTCATFRGMAARQESRPDCESCPQRAAAACAACTNLPGSRVRLRRSSRKKRFLLTSRRARARASRHMHMGRAGQTILRLQYCKLPLKRPHVVRHGRNYTVYSCSMTIYETYMMLKTISEAHEILRGPHSDYRMHVLISTHI